MKREKTERLMRDFSNRRGGLSISKKDDPYLLCAAQ
jgi:hypothetical protein